MDFEKMQSTMQFLLERRAKHYLAISQHEDRMNELREGFKILTALAEKQKRRMDSDNNRQGPPLG